MILVTGGLGMIGTHTARALVDHGQDVVVTAHRRTEVPSFLLRLAGRVTLERLDVTDRAAFLALGRRHPITDIVHLAGSMPGDDPVACFRTDTSGLLNALDHPAPGVCAGSPWPTAAAGSMPHRPGAAPFVAGYDAVVTLDSGAHVYRVAPPLLFGALAEQVPVPDDRAIPVPTGFDPVVAAALGVPGLAAWLSLEYRGALRSGEPESSRSQAVLVRRRGPGLDLPRPRGRVRDVSPVHARGGRPLLRHPHPR